MTDQEQIQWLSDAYEDCKVRLWEAKSQINNKGILLQHEVLKDKYKIRGEQIEALEQQIKDKNTKIGELKLTIREMKKVEPIVDEGVMVIQGTSELGRWVPQHKYLKLLEEWKHEKERNKSVTE